jgi:hypothetical protein
MKDFVNAQTRFSASPHLSTNLYSPLPEISASLQETIEHTQAEQDRVRESTNFLAEFQRANLANVFAKGLLDHINHFNDELDEDKEVGCSLFHLVKLLLSTCLI